MNTAPINLSPKSRFQQSQDNVSRHRALLETREFERASDFALVQFCAGLSESIKDMNSAAIAGMKLQGAFEYAHTFRNLGEIPPRPPLAITKDNLDHKV